jgi:hypothetical protein
VRRLMAIAWNARRRSNHSCQERICAGGWVGSLDQPSAPVALLAYAGPLLVRG